MPITLRPILPRIPSPRSFDRATEDGLRAFLRGRVKEQFDLTTQTWRTYDLPTYTIDVHRRGAAVYVGDFVVTGRIYRFVSEGTKDRFGVMTPGFSPKTRAGRIAARQGQGGLWYVASRRNPRPGIQPRKFDEQIAKDPQTIKALRDIAQAAIRQAAKEIGRG